MRKETERILDNADLKPRCLWCGKPISRLSPEPGCCKEHTEKYSRLIRACMKEFLGEEDDR